VIATLHDFLRQPIIERLGWTLLHFVWQGAAIATMYGIALVAQRRHSAAARYLAGCLAMLLMILAPIATFLLISISPPGIPARSQAALATMAMPKIDNAASSLAQTAAPPFEQAVSPSGSHKIVQTLSARLDPLLPGVVGCWILGVFLLSLQLLGGWKRAQRMKRSGVSLSDALWTERLAELVRRMELSCPVHLLQSTLIEAPIVLGWLRPAILLPASVFCNLSPQQLDAILAHELAHIRRHDYVVNLFQTLVETLLFYHPAVWWISRRVRQERENCCDDVAVAVYGDRIAYARALAALEELRGASPQFALAARGGSLLARVRRLVAFPNTDARRSTWWPVGMLIASVMAAVIVSACLASTNRPATVAKTQLSQSAIATNMLAIRVVDPDGKPIRVKEVESIRVYVNETLWSDLIPTWQPTNDSILVKRSSILQPRPGQKIELLFVNEQDLPVWASGVVLEDTNRPVVLTAESTKETPDIDETSGPKDVQPDELAGRVVDPQGNPVTGATVSIGNNYPKRTPAKTDSQGVFRFPGFGQSHYTYLQVEQPGFATRWITDVVVGHGFTVQLDNSTRVKGQFLLPDGKPAAKSTITLFHDKRTKKSTMRFLVSGLRLDRETDDQGRYDLLLEPGVYEVQVASTNGFFLRQAGWPVDAGKVGSLPNQLQPGAQVRLQAVDSDTGKPVVGARFFIWNSPRPYYMEVKPGTERVTDDQGVAEWDSLLLGHTRFEISKEGYRRFWATNDLDHQRGSWQGIERPRYAGALSPLQLDLERGMAPVVVQAERGVRVSGKVIGADGQPVVKAQLDVNVPGMGTFSGDARFRIVADEKGQFNGWLPAGNGTIYDLSVHDPQGRWANAVSKPFSSKPGDELEFTFQLPSGGWINGRVVDRNGQPIPRLKIEIVADDHLDNPYFNPETTTDSEGHFKLGPLRAGSYGMQRHLFTINTPVWKGPETLQFSVADGQTTHTSDLIFMGEPPKTP
jgi:beta-lactamase regulating signal transducer with metallopeptidase domain